MRVEIPNPARDRLRRGELSLGVGLRQARTVDIASIMRACGFDWLFIDLEHNSMSLDVAAQISVAALGHGIAPVVRVSEGAYALATRALDAGALGIVMPHVGTAAQAAELVDRLRYPPLGHRSMGGGAPQLGFRPIAPGETAEAVNAATLIVPMIETPEGVENADAIAAVNGVDALLIGTNDLAMEYGVPGRFDAPVIDEAYARVIAACGNHGKAPGMGGVYQEALMRKRISQGMRFILSGGDLAFLMAGAEARTRFLRGCLA